MGWRLGQVEGKDKQENVLEEKVAGFPKRELKKLNSALNSRKAISAPEALYFRRKFVYDRNRFTEAMLIVQFVSFLSP